MKQRKQSVAISREDVERAIAGFRRKGGIITRLPDEVAPRHLALREISVSVEATLDETLGLEPAWSGSPFPVAR